GKERRAVRAFPGEESLWRRSRPVSRVGMGTCRPRGVELGAPTLDALPNGFLESLGGGFVIPARRPEIILRYKMVGVIMRELVAHPMSELLCPAIMGVTERLRDRKGAPRRDVREGGIDGDDRRIAFGRRREVHRSL